MLVPVRRLRGGRGGGCMRRVEWRVTVARAARAHAGAKTEGTALGDAMSLAKT